MQNERTEELIWYLNGSYPRQSTARLGSMLIHVPSIRDGIE
jgi:hypothetical protein